MDKLTKAEEEVMLALWELEQATVREVMNKMEEPDTPYTTISTVIRVLEQKGYIGHKAIGNTYLYHPLLLKKDYVKQSLSGFMNKYFEGSFSNMASFLAKENDMSMRDLREMMQDIKEDIRDERKLKED